ncbi:MAG: ADP-ribosylglycohydrolase family protein [Polyangia bacterium]
MKRSGVSIRAKMLGGLWGSVVGDALGVPVEFHSREERERDPVQEVRGFGTYNQPPGTWSDDSSLMLCSLHSLLERGFDLADMGQRFVRYLTDSYMTPHGSVFDVGIATATAIDKLRAGCIAEEAGGKGERDNGNGSLMRILPIALFFYRESAPDLIARAHLASRVTHGHPRSQLACGYACLFIARLLCGDSAAVAYERVNAQIPRLYSDSHWQSELPHFARILSGRLAGEPKSTIRGSGYVVHTLEASVYLLLRSSTYSQTVLDAINLGEDTDTTACVAGGMAGVLYGEDAIPKDWLAPLARREHLDTWFRLFVDNVQPADS